MPDSKYEFVLKMVDWKSLLCDQKFSEKLQRVTINEATSIRDMFNGTVVDILFYLSKSYRSLIIRRVVDEMNKYFDETKKLYGDRFKN